MTMTTGRKQLMGFLGCVAAAAALTGLLVMRQGVNARQAVVENQTYEVEQKLNKVEDQINSTADPAEKKKLDERKQELAAEVEKKKAEKKDLAPHIAYKMWSWEKKKWERRTWEWWPAATWVAILGLLVAFGMTHGLSGDHGKRLMVTVGLALVAAGFLHFRGIAKGIDLSGGAELRYRLDTAEIDRQIDALRARREEIKTPEGLKRLEGEISAKQKQLDAAGSDVERTAINHDLNDLKAQLTDKGIDNLLRGLEEERKRDMGAAVNNIRKRLDTAGLREISVQAMAGGLVAQVPLRETTAVPGESAEERRQRKMGQLQIDVRELKRLIETPGVLTFHDVDACDSYQRNAVRWQEACGDQTRDIKAKRIPGYVLKDYRDVKASGQERHEKLLLREQPVTSGQNLTKALVTSSSTGGGAEVLVFLDATGATAIEEYTGPNRPPEDKVKYQETRMAIVLDGRVMSAPVIQSRLGSPFSITGNFTPEEADQLCQVLNSGSLSFKPVLDHETAVGPGLGDDAISAGMRASLVGSLLVVLFMGVYYLSGGLAAIAALALNILLVLGAMAMLGGTMTLPGIAGIALTVGMAVDANVLIFERIREEKARGKPLKLALKAGHDRAAVTILDSNFTTMIIALILYIFGTGPVKGFAVTLFLGLLINLFTALYVANAVLEYALARNWLTEMRMLSIIGVPKLHFLRVTAVMATVSTILVAGSLYLIVPVVCNAVGVFPSLAARARNDVGLDFTGGLEVIAQMAEPTDTSRVRAAAAATKERMGGTLKAALEKARGSASFRDKDWPSEAVNEFNVQAYEPSADGKQRFRIFCQLSDEQQQVLEGRLPGETPAAGAKAAKTEIQSYFGDAFAAGGLKLDSKEPFPMISRIGSRVAGELLGKAFLAFFFSLAAMFIYIVLRFDFMVGFGLGAVISLFHDSIIALGALILANRLGMPGAQVDLVIVAAILTIIGFSINDTIVVFDRIRENRPAMRSLPLMEVVNTSVNQTLARTILTSFTVFVAVACLLVLGGGTLRPFSLVFLAGIVVGTYSSIYIAAAIGVYWENWRDRVREAEKRKLHAAPAQAN